MKSARVCYNGITIGLLKNAIARHTRRKISVRKDPYIVGSAKYAPVRLETAAPVATLNTYIYMHVAHPIVIYALAKHKLYV